jgi:hypothetical protein
MWLVDCYILIDKRTESCDMIFNVSPISQTIHSPIDPQSNKIDSHVYSYALAMGTFTVGRDWRTFRALGHALF